jgi:hypothetical protein
VHGGTVRAVIGAIPSVTVVEHLVLPGPALELDHEDCLYLGPVSGGHPRVNGFDGYAFRKEIELVHASL